MDTNLGGLNVTNESAQKKDLMMIDSSPPLDFEISKRAIRRQKKEAEKRQKMDILDKAMRDLQEKKAELEFGGKHKGKLVVPSPRDSSKGGKSKRPVVPDDKTKDTKVCMAQGGRRMNHDSVDSSNCSFPGSLIISDPHSIGIWDTVKDVPPCEVNSVGHPIGQFWEHMQSYTYDRAPWLFEWDIPWPQQPKEMKRNFANRICSLYPGKYEIDYVLEDVGANIRQRRQRTRNHMKKNGCKQFTPIAHGLTVKSWNNIWASLSNPTYQGKSNKCKIAAEARTKRIGYTHRLGAMGVEGLIKKFVSLFFMV